MKAQKFWMVIPALLVGLAVGVASAKLPAPSEEAKAAAAAKKAKASEAAKKAAADLARSQDRVAERYKREKGMKTTAAPKMKK